MAFPLKDLRFTTRRGGGETILYPRLLRDRSILPKVDIAIQYFESMLGHKRRELDPEVMVHFFGDYKLARCIVACLARTYRYRPIEVEQVVKPPAMRRLRRAELQTPKALRISLFDRVNQAGPGFLPSSERDAILQRMAMELGLRGGGELERLLHLDADEHAVLGRVGVPPTAADVVAHHNFVVLETALRHAELLELTLAEVAPDVAEAVARLCASNDVVAAMTQPGGDGRLILRGRQDGLGSWARHGRKVARTVVQLLERGRPMVREGSAQVALRGRRGTLRLTAEALDVLAGAPAPSAGWHDLEGWDGAALLERLRGPRAPRSGRIVRKLPDPLAWTAGVIVPDLLVQDGHRSALICAVRSTAHAVRLALIAPTATTGEPCVFVGDPTIIAPLTAVGAPALGLERFDLDAILAALPDVLAAGHLRQVA
ncbi:MAG: hypothetical protein H0V51_26125 [Chloroflexi bacterium]|nr:hypothetical protein [Chloroflexota bacterium]